MFSLVENAGPLPMGWVYDDNDNNDDNDNDNDDNDNDNDDNEMMM